MTPPHIEAAARAICIAQDEDPDATSLSHPEWRGWHQWVGAAKASLPIYRAATLEEAAKVAENWSDAQHIAHDMKTGVFPKQTKVWDAIAARLRALSVEG